MILVIDDSITVRMDLVSALDEAGLPAISVASLAEARASLAERSIALVVLDVMLPDGDGVEFLGWLRASAKYSELPVLMLSAESDVKDRIRGLRTGATDYIGKPYDASYVIARARQLTRPRTLPGVQTILVVDDSASVRGVVAEALETAGYSVITAADGATGLQTCARERPAAVVVDGFMPEMDGPTMIRRIRLDPALRTTPCLMLTGSGSNVPEIAAFDAGADAFVRKDEDVSVIVARLAAMLRNAVTHPAPVQAQVANRVLAIDDDRTDSLSSVLREAGYDAVHTASGDEAVELLSIQQVDCILLDWDLPGSPAAGLCQRIKLAIRDTPLIVRVAAGTQTVTLDALAAGADDVIAKSASAEILLARIRTQMRRRRVEDDLRKAREQLVRAELADQLEQANANLTRAYGELESFTYSVSHDLRAPLRTIQRFAGAVLEDAGETLDATHRDYLGRVVRSSHQLSEMIEALLALSRLDRSPIDRGRVDLSAIANGVFAELRDRDPVREVEVIVPPGVTAHADARLVRAVLDNLLGNAWKFTQRTERARIEIGSELAEGRLAYFVRDNGAGFDPSQSDKLFVPFQRLHRDAAFPGHGIGLATVRRIVERHGGRIWAESEVDAGATFRFTLG